MISYGERTGYKVVDVTDATPLGALFLEAWQSAERAERPDLVVKLVGGFVDILRHPGKVDSADARKRPEAEVPRPGEGS